ncbi:MAG: hypothetical protein PHV30_04210 [Candidatus Margulisbacteria bacterium]|nr:hypothetical protein [Candidatus Margulisiibacteriota bacterium]
MKLIIIYLFANESVLMYTFDLARMADEIYQEEISRLQSIVVLSTVKNISL